MRDTDTAGGQRLVVFQSLWAMKKETPEGLTGGPLDEQLERIAAAGFDGVTLDFFDREFVAEATGLATRLGLQWNAQCYPRNPEMLAHSLELVREYGADHVNAQPNATPFTLAESVAFLEGLHAVAIESSVPVLFETHRDRVTTDLFHTLQLLDELPWLRLTADLSHYLVGREFPLPVSDHNHELIRRITDRSDGYHGRVGTREQVQVPLFDHNRPWLELFLGWWRTGFASWRARSAPDATLVFLTELGPPPYALTGRDGKELSDRWVEAQELMSLVRGEWASMSAP
jgi:hypothetical protein